MAKNIYPNGNPWSQSDLNFLRDKAGVMTLREIASSLNRTYASVRTMSTRISLQLRSNYKPWTTADLRELKDKAGKISANEIASSLGRSLHSVKGKASVLGISLLCIGERHHLSIYSDHDVSLCCALHDEGMAQTTIAEKMEIPVHGVHAFIHGKRLTQIDTAWRNQQRSEER